MESYIQTLKSDYTKKAYTSFLKKVEEAVGTINKKNLKKVKEYIDSLPMKPKTIQDRHWIMKGYLTHLGIKPYKFNTEPIELEKKTLPTKDEIQQKLDSMTINNKQDKLILNLLFRYPQVLRTDLADVKLKDIDETKPHYKDGKIIFPTIRKTKYKNIVITLKPEDKDLIESLHQEWLLNMKAHDRNNAYTKYIKRITQKYLDKGLSQTDIRHITATDDAVDQNIDQSFIEKYKLLSMLASQRGHSLSTSLRKYTNI